MTLRERLASNALYFRKSLQDLGLDTGVSTTHVVPIILKDRAFLYQSGLRLRERGASVSPITLGRHRALPGCR